MPRKNGYLQSAGTDTCKFKPKSYGFLFQVRKLVKAGHSDKDMQPLVRVENLVKSYAKRRLTGQREDVRAVDGVSFSIFPGTTLAVVGESGSGKSTLAFCLACLERPTSGRIIFQGNEITELDEKQQRAVRPQIQLVFQDPARSLNPRFSALELVSKPL